MKKLRLLSFEKLGPAGDVIEVCKIMHGVEGAAEKVLCVLSHCTRPVEHSMK